MTRKKKIKPQQLVHNLPDGREVTELVPGHGYLFDDGIRLQFVRSLLVVDNENKLSVALVFMNEAGKAVTMTFPKNK